MAGAIERPGVEISPAASQVALIVSGLKSDDYDRRMALAADRQAADHLRAGRPLLMIGDDAHYVAFASIADRAEAKGLHEAKAALSALDDWYDKNRQNMSDALEAPSDAACDRWRPHVDAAFYFGLMLGLRVGGQSGGGL